MCQWRSIGMVALSLLFLWPVPPLFAQSSSVKLNQDAIHSFSRVLDIPFDSQTVSIVGLYPGDQWTVAEADRGMVVRVTNHKPLEPPGARDFKVADLYMGVSHFDVLIDNGYYAKIGVDTEGSIYPGFGELLYHSWPVRPDGSLVPQLMVSHEDIHAEPGYEFVRWVGDPVDRGYVPDPTSPTLYVYGEYFYDTARQYYVNAQFGVPTAPGAVLVSLPGTPVSVAFDNIDAAGHTILTMSDSGPNPPAGLQLGNPGTYFDISTTASFSGGVDVSIDYSAFAFTVPPEELRLFHYEADQWRDCTTSVDEINRVIRGRVYSLSPFVILEPAAVPAPGAFLLAGGGLAALGSLRRRLL